eukprot:SAG11_NODE_978_length_6325_cov_13.105204_1_plen_120_part_00
MNLERYLGTRVPPTVLGSFFSTLKVTLKTVGTTVLWSLQPADADFQGFQNRPGLARCRTNSTTDFLKINKTRRCCNSIIKLCLIYTVYSSVETLSIQAINLDRIYAATYEFCFGQVDSS